jgi:plasmid stabilization system protein ParE
MTSYALEIIDAAEAEIFDITSYYKQFDDKLSTDFINEMDKTIEYLREFPNAGHRYLHDTRRILLDRFP